MTQRRTDILLKKAANKGSAKKDQAARDAEAVRLIEADLFPRQLEFAQDYRQNCSLLCPRRAGKSHSAVAKALIVAHKYPGCRVAIVALSLKNAKSLYWGIIDAFNVKYNLQLDAKIADAVYKLPNGSMVVFNGAETVKDVDKLRGFNYKLVIIDECQSINEEVFQYALHDVITPATGDVSGSISLIGTPGEALAGLFYEATCHEYSKDYGSGRMGPVTVDAYEPEPFWDDPPQFDGKPIIPQWRRHHWTPEHNVYAPDIWKNALLYKQRYQIPDNHPTWVREYLGRWTSSGDTMVYAVANLLLKDGVENCRATWSPGFNLPAHNKHGLPLNANGIDDWHYVLGMDLGFEDACAFSVMAYSDSRGVLYQVHEDKRSHMIVPQIAATIDQIMRRFDGKIERMVGDMGAQGKLIVESINRMYSLNVEPAEKTAKYDHISLFNGDLWEGRIKILAGGETFQEMVKLQWVVPNALDRQTAIRLGKLKEDPRRDNHLCDATLYTWRFCYHHFSRKIAAPPVVGTPEWVILEEQRELEEILRDAALEHAAKTADPALLPTLSGTEIDGYNRLFGRISTKKPGRH